jgi:hypothetical protein
MAPEYRLPKVIHARQSLCVRMGVNRISPAIFVCAQGTLIPSHTAGMVSPVRDTRSASLRRQRWNKDEDDRLVTAVETCKVFLYHPMANGDC